MNKLNQITFDPVTGQFGRIQNAVRLTTQELQTQIDKIGQLTAKYESLEYNAVNIKSASQEFDNFVANRGPDGNMQIQAAPVQMDESDVDMAKLKANAEKKASQDPMAQIESIKQAIATIPAAITQAFTTGVQNAAGQLNMLTQYVATAVTTWVANLAVIPVQFTSQFTTATQNAAGMLNLLTQHIALAITTWTTSLSAFAVAFTTQVTIGVQGAGVALDLFSQLLGTYITNWTTLLSTFAVQFTTQITIGVQGAGVALDLLSQLLGTYITSWSTLISNFAVNFATQFTIAVQSAGTALGLLGEFIAGFVGTAATNILGLQNVFLNSMAVMANTAIAGFTAIGEAAFSTFTQILTAANATVVAINKGFNQLANAVVGYFNGMASRTVTAFRAILTAANQTATGINNAFHQAVNAALGYISQLSTRSATAFSTMASNATKVADAVRSIGSAASAAASQVESLASALNNIPSSVSTTINVGLSGPGAAYLQGGTSGQLYFDEGGNAFFENGEGGFGDLHKKNRRRAIVGETNDERVIRTGLRTGTRREETVTRMKTLSNLGMHEPEMLTVIPTKGYYAQRFKERSALGKMSSGVMGGLAKVLGKFGLSFPTQGASNIPMLAFGVSSGADPNTAHGPIITSPDGKIYTWENGGTAYTITQWNNNNDESREFMAESDDIGIKQLPDGSFLEEDYSVTMRGGSRTSYVNNKTWRSGANAGEPSDAYDSQGNPTYKYGNGPTTGGGGGGGGTGTGGGTGGARDTYTAPSFIKTSGSGGTWQGANTSDPTTWKSVTMINDPSKWKVVDANGKNIATEFPSQDAADEYIDNHVYAKQSGTFNGPTPAGGVLRYTNPNVPGGGTGGGTGGGGTPTGTTSDYNWPTNTPLPDTHYQMSTGYKVANYIQTPGHGTTGTSPQWQNPNMNPNSWRAVEMTSPEYKGRWKIVDDKGINIAANFQSKASAEEVINEHRAAYIGGTGTGGGTGGGGGGTGTGGTTYTAPSGIFDETQARADYAATGKPVAESWANVDTSDPFTWSAVPHENTTGTDTKWKVVNKDGKNIAVRFNSKAEAEEYIRKHQLAKQGGVYSGNPLGGGQTLTIPSSAGSGGGTGGTGGGTTNPPPSTGGGGTGGGNIGSPTQVVESGNVRIEKYANGGTRIYIGGKLVLDTTGGGGAGTGTPGTGTGTGTGTPLGNAYFAGAAGASYNHNTSTHPALTNVGSGTGGTGTGSGTGTGTSIPGYNGNFNYQVNGHQLQVQNGVITKNDLTAAEYAQADAAFFAATGKHLPAYNGGTGTGTGTGTTTTTGTTNQTSTVNGQNNNTNYDTMVGTNNRLRIQNGQVVEATGIFAGYGTGTGTGSGTGTGTGTTTTPIPEGQIRDTIFKSLAMTGGLSPFLSSAPVPSSPFPDSINAAIDNQADPLFKEFTGSINKPGELPVPGGGGLPPGGGGSGGYFDWLRTLLQAINRMIYGMVDRLKVNVTNQINETSFLRVTSDTLLQNMKRY